MREIDAIEQEFVEFTDFVAQMRHAGQPEGLIASFGEHYARYRRGESGKVPWDEVLDVEAGDVIDVEAFGACDEAEARELLSQLVVIKLNGGLGTTMKLERAKSLIAVRGARSFLEVIADHVSALRGRYGVQIPLLLMNSFRTRDDSLAELQRFEQPRLPLDFLQHKVPRIDARTQRPLRLESEEDCWAPPGHGDVYLALALSGLLAQLIERGYRWAFVSNADNLGATVEPRILAQLAAREIEFAMEVTAKTAADRKGGTLVRRRGRLTLLERAQVPDAHVAAFEDIDRFSVFNTNSLWWNLEALAAKMRQGALELPLIVNPKRVDEVEVVQLETAMGAAVGSFASAVGLRVPRQRFAPVKATNDLLGVRSDAYSLDDQGGLRLSAQRERDWGPPLIELDERFYRGIADFELRFPHPLSLLQCRRLRVEGDVRFGRDVIVRGEVTLRNSGDTPLQIGDGTVLADEILQA